MTEYYIAFWNLENFFDVENSPRRSEKLQRILSNELTGWTESILNRKTSQLASIISRMNQENGPDIIGVCEIENDYVLNKLVAALSSLNRNYALAHHDMSDKRGIDVAFIYDSDLFTAEKQFSHFIVKRTATRDLFQVNFRTANNRLLVVIGNHWPSRRGGQYESEPYRIIAGETLAYFHLRIKEIYGDDVAVIVMGDFNDEPYNRSLSDYALSEKTSIKVTQARTPRFLNLMWQLSGEGNGTHYYENTPNMLDQFLISNGIVSGNSSFRIVDNSVEVVRFSEMINTGNYPSPIKFGRKDSINQNGFSDHFPIALKIMEE